jgi:hypothetical protein
LIRPRPTRWVAVSAAVMSILVLPIRAAQAGAQRQLRLEVRQVPPDPNHSMVGAPPAKNYIGRLRNRGESPLLIQIIPISDRDQGNGKFGSCYLERWDSATRRWIYLPPTLIAVVEPVQIKTLMLKPRDAIDLCTASFSQEAGQHAECYGFRLQLQIGGLSSPLMLFRTFQVGATNGSSALCPH